MQGNWEGGQRKNSENMKYNPGKTLRMFSWSTVGHVWMSQAVGGGVQTWPMQRAPCWGGGQSQTPAGRSEGPPAQQGWFQSLCASAQLKPSDTELISPPGRAALLILKCLNVMGKVSMRRLIRH